MIVRREKSSYLEVNSHKEMMDEYYAIREAWERKREKVTGMYSSEIADFERENPRPTFKKFLKGRVHFHG